MFYSVYSLKKIAVLPCLPAILTSLTLRLHFQKVNVAFVALSGVKHFPNKHVISKAVCETVFLLKEFCVHFSIVY